MRKVETILMGLIFVANSAWGKWSPNIREDVLKAAKESKVEGPPGYVSLWGGIKRKWNGGNLKGELRDYYVKSFFKKGELPIYFYEQDKPAALSIFFPGIFGQHDGDLGPKMIDLLENKGSHVAVIPNFLSENYIKSEPVYLSDVTKTDIGAAAQVVHKVFLSIKPEKVKRINLIGESLGSIVASGVLAEINKRKLFENLKVNIVLFWPPVQLKKALTNFDSRFKDSAQTYKECSFWYRYPKVFYHFVIQDTPKGTSDDFVKCIDSYLYHGVFKKGIEKSITNVWEVKGIKNESLPQNFLEFFKQFNPNFYKMVQENDPKLDLSYWLRQRRQSQTTVRIVSSKDDFINDGIDWDLFLEKSYLSKDNLILLDWGAHSAGLAMDIWDNVLYSEILHVKKGFKWPFSKKSI
jgi:hypothetical protein